ncbi:hypothetical protein IFM12276_50620 [Nocardia sputorum]|uniref:DUF222 domain-containing protein n=1 Tax=Nocardia sputorum TaxID=2984338 RepID=A0ABM8D3R6_9NOCA|nr:hypothetical protein IFM12276_50620 [Nocardia sputorum]
MLGDGAPGRGGRTQLLGLARPDAGLAEDRAQRVEVILARVQSCEVSGTGWGWPTQASDASQSRIHDSAVAPPPTG